MRFASAGKLGYWKRRGGGGGGGGRRWSPCWEEGREWGGCLLGEGVAGLLNKRNNLRESVGVSLPTLPSSFGSLLGQSSSILSPDSNRLLLPSSLCLCPSLCLGRLSMSEGLLVCPRSSFSLSLSLSVYPSVSSVFMVCKRLIVFLKKDE